MLNKVIHTYNITLTTGEVLENIKVKGSLEYNFSGMGSVIATKDMDGKTIVLTKYQIVKAELVDANTE